MDQDWTTECRGPSAGSPWETACAESSPRWRCQVLAACHRGGKIGFAVRPTTQLIADGCGRAGSTLRGASMARMEVESWTFRAFWWPRVWSC
jgi:hypothetical protein